MTRTFGVSLLALALAFPSLATAAKKQHVPGQIVQARYVCLGYDTGDGFLSEQDSIRSPYEVFPDDRRILNAVRDELEKWGKYVITVRPEQAEILIAVRAGRTVGVTGGVGIGVGIGGRGGGMDSRTGMGGVQFSSPQDIFTVYDHNGRGVLWRVQKKGGLAGSPPQAFADFRSQVESAPAPKKDEPKEGENPKGETAVPEAKGP